LAPLLDAALLCSLVEPAVVAFAGAAGAPELLSGEPEG
jgi:hypothetical protein